MKTLTTILLLAISLSASGQLTIKGKPYSMDKRPSTRFLRYQMWDKPTRTHITGVIDSVKVEHRNGYSFYWNYVNGLKIASFTRMEKGQVIDGWLKKMM